MPQPNPVMQLAPWQAPGTAEYNKYVTTAGYLTAHPQTGQAGLFDRQGNQYRIDRNDFGYGVYPNETVTPIPQPVQQPQPMGVNPLPQQPPVQPVQQVPYKPPSTLQSQIIQAPVASPVSDRLAELQDNLARAQTNPFVAVKQKDLAELHDLQAQQQPGIQIPQTTLAGQIQTQAQPTDMAVGQAPAPPVAETPSAPTSTRTLFEEGQTPPPAGRVPPGVSGVFTTPGGGLTNIDPKAAADAAKAAADAGKDDSDSTLKWLQDMFIQSVKTVVGSGQQVPMAEPISGGSLAKTLGVTALTQWINSQFQSALPKEFQQSTQALLTGQPLPSSVSPQAPGAIQGLQQVLAQSQANLRGQLTPGQVAQQNLVLDQLRQNENAKAQSLAASMTAQGITGPAALAITRQAADAAARTQAFTLAGLAAQRETDAVHNIIQVGQFTYDSAGRIAEAVRQGQIQTQAAIMALLGNPDVIRGIGGKGGLVDVAVGALGKLAAKVPGAKEALGKLGINLPGGAEGEPITPGQAPITPEQAVEEANTAKEAKSLSDLALQLIKNPVIQKVAAVASTVAYLYGVYKSVQAAQADFKQKSPELIAKAIASFQAAIGDRTKADIVNKYTRGNTTQIIQFKDGLVIGSRPPYIQFDILRNPGPETPLTGITGLWTDTGKKWYDSKLIQATDLKVTVPEASAERIARIAKGGFLGETAFPGGKETTLSTRSIAEAPSTSGVSSLTPDDWQALYTLAQLEMNEAQKSQQAQRQTPAQNNILFFYANLVGARPTNITNTTNTTTSTTTQNPTTITTNIPPVVVQSQPPVVNTPPPPYVPPVAVPPQLPGVKTNITPPGRGYETPPPPYVPPEEKVDAIIDAAKQKDKDKAKKDIKDIITTKPPVVETQPPPYIPNVTGINTTYPGEDIAQGILSAIIQSIAAKAKEVISTTGPMTSTLPLPYTPDVTKQPTNINMPKEREKPITDSVLQEVIDAATTKDKDAAKEKVADIISNIQPPPTVYIPIVAPQTTTPSQMYPPTSPGQAGAEGEGQMPTPLMNIPPGTTPFPQIPPQPLPTQPAGNAPGPLGYTVDFTGGSPSGLETTGLTGKEFKPSGLTYPLAVSPTGQPVPPTNIVDIPIPAISDTAPPLRKLLTPQRSSEVALPYRIADFVNDNLQYPKVPYGSFDVKADVSNLIGNRDISDISRAYYKSVGAPRDTIIVKLKDGTIFGSHVPFTNWAIFRTSDMPGNYGTEAGHITPEAASWFSNGIINVDDIGSSFYSSSGIPPGAFSTPLNIPRQPLQQGQALLSSGQLTNEEIERAQLIEKLPPLYRDMLTTLPNLAPDIDSLRRFVASVT